MAKVVREIFFGNSKKADFEFSLKLYLTVDKKIIITDADYNPNADMIFVEISFDEWDEITSFVQDELKNTDEQKTN